MTHKQRYQFLLVGIGVFTIIAYWLAFGKTWTAFNETKQLEQQLSNAGQAWQQIEYYQKELQRLENEQNNQQFTQNYLFQKVTSFCQENKLSIQEMPESKVFEQQDMQLLHNLIKVEGAYIPMIKLLYDLEQVQNLGRVVSVEFNLGKNYQSRKKELTAAICLQNILNKTSSK